MSESDDFILLNAYHDGELDDATCKLVRERLLAEPELRHMLDEIGEVSAALRDLRPSVEPLGRRGTGIAILWKIAAACLILAISMSALLLGTAGSSEVSILDWHRKFVAQTYESEGMLKPVSATRWIDEGADLSAARLTLVDVAREKDGDIYLHYSGVSGCRLTFGAHDAEPAFKDAEDGFLIEKWQAGAQHYSLVAVGMDRKRFAAIATLLRERTERERVAEQLYASLRQATANAVPCA